MINPFINLTSSFVGTKFNIKQSLIRAFFILPLLLSVTACGDDADTESTDTENTADTTPPVITLNGADEITLEYNSQYEELGATALDDVDGSLTVQIIGSLTVEGRNGVFVYAVKTSFITYKATDNSGNSTTKTRVVKVVDTTVPTITLVGDSTVEIIQNYDYEELGAIARDGYDFINLYIEKESDVDTTVVGNYTVTYNTKDSSGNEASVTRNVNVIESTPFITTWRTTEPNELILIPTDGGGYNYSIDWGDGSEIEESRFGDPNHRYADAGTYTVTITGVFPQLYSYEFKLEGFFSSEHLMSVEQWGNTPWRSMEFAFYNAANLTINATDTPVLTNVESMNFMFYGASNFNSDISNWNVSNVTSMDQMFYDATAFNQPLDSWDVSNVNYMGSMFSGATAFNQPLDSWDVSNVRTMWYMFYGATAFNQPLNSWDVSNVTHMDSMFKGTTVFNQPLDSWDVSNVTDMDNMFEGATVFNQPLDSWDVSNVTDMGSMFSGATAFNQPLNSWDVSNLSSGGYNLGAMMFMFSGATAFNQPLDSWDVSSATDMRSMFSGATAFNQRLDSWDVSNVTNMAVMLSLSGLSTENYDALLNGWSLQILHSSLTFDVSAKYSSASEAARQSIIDTYNWTINDDGLLVE
jgi:surface protein